MPKDQLISQSFNSRELLLLLLFLTIGIKDPKGFGKKLM